MQTDSQSHIGRTGSRERDKLMSRKCVKEAKERNNAMAHSGQGKKFT